MRQSVNNTSSVIRIRIDNDTLNGLPAGFNVTKAINEHLQTLTSNAQSSNKGKHNETNNTN
jgi:hypothetical protein